MRILLYVPDSDCRPWIDALRRPLPQASVRAWKEGDQDPADYLIVWKPPAHVLQPRKSLKAVFLLGAGADAALHSAHALPPTMPIVRLEDAGMAMQMAEYVSYAVLRYYRRFDEFEQQQREQVWQVLAAHDKSEFGIGILGMGQLGSRIAQALRTFGFPLHGWSKTPKRIDGMQCYAGPQELPALLRRSRVLVCALPLTSETQSILQRATLAQLPQGAYLINVARGAHLVEEDLLALLGEGHLAGATLDVFRDEPLPASHPFWTEPRITITPHSSAQIMLKQSIAQIAEKIAALEQGIPIRGIVDRERGY
jgi:glyoxylate/hydroxypyruvate reductase A